MACDLYLLHTRPAQVKLNSMPSSFVITYVFCLAYFSPFPFALSVQMLCTHIPVGLIFRLDLEPSMQGLPCLIFILDRAVIAVCFHVACVQVSLMSGRTVCAADQLLQHGFGDAHASACFSYNRLGSGLSAGFSLFV